MPREIGDWRDLTADDFYTLPGGNVYVEDYGYLTDPELIEPHRLRNQPDHWNAQFENAQAFRAEWKPRPGPQELICLLAQEKKIQSDEPFTVMNMGAGLGDFTAALAKLPNVHVTNVDFSDHANRIAQETAGNFGVTDAVTFVTATNLEVLEAMRENGEQTDFIFFYGGLGENTPLEQEIADTLLTATKVVKPGGRIWYVGLEQPFLSGEGDTTATDILGEFPTRQGLIEKTMSDVPGMRVVKQVHGKRPDKHPLVPGGPSEEHMHIIYRALFVKQNPDGTFPETPEFGFSEAVNPQKWQAMWENLINKNQ